MHRKKYQVFKWEDNGLSGKKIKCKSDFTRSIKILRVLKKCVLN